MYAANAYRRMDGALRKHDCEPLQQILATQEMTTEVETTTQAETTTQEMTTSVAPVASVM